MKKTSQFNYNRWFVILSLASLFLLIILYIARAYQLGDPDNNQGLRYFIYFFIFLLLIFVRKYFVPWWKGKAALELNDFGIIDFVRNRRVNWENFCLLYTSD